jgi:hypothetical protein
VRGRRALLAGLALAPAAAAEDCAPLAAWREARDAPTLANPRRRQLALVERCVRAGATRAEVLALLGPPDAETPAMLTFELGAAFPRMDTEALLVLLEGGRVTALRRTQR